MNLPNKITLIRVVMIPLFLFFYLAGPLAASHANMWLALIIFSTAALTDALDGYLARKMGLVTNFGKLMDPLADKLLVCSALVAFVATGALPAWAVIMMISREFYISGLRQLAVEQKIVLAASVGAKFKTAIQIILIIYLLIPITEIVQEPVVIALMIISIAASVCTAVDYTLKNKSVLKN